VIPPNTEVHLPCWGYGLDPHGTYLHHGKDLAPQVRSGRAVLCIKPDPWGLPKWQAHMERSKRSKPAHARWGSASVCVVNASRCNFILRANKPLGHFEHINDSDVVCTIAATDADKELLRNRLELAATLRGN
jgi:hypothetical protein